MSNRKTYESLFVICIGLCVIALFKKNEYLATASAILLVLGLAVPPFRRILHNAWWKLSAVLGYINGKIIFSVFFVILIIPIGIIIKFKKKQILNANSSFQERNHLYQANDLKHIF